MDIKLKAQKRDLTGRKVKRLRKEGLVPANIFGNKVENMIIQLNLLDMQKAYEKAGETSLIELQVATDGKKDVEKRVVLISNIQTDPITDQFIHIDFHEVNLKEKVKAQVPIEQSGEAPAIKQGTGTVVTYIDEVEVEALPTDLPESFVVDLTSLEKVDDAIFIKDLNYDKDKVTLEIDPEEIIVKVEELREEEAEPEPVAEEGQEAETTVQGKESDVEGTEDGAKSSEEATEEKKDK